MTDDNEEKGPRELTAFKRRLAYFFFALQGLGLYAHLTGDLFQWGSVALLINFVVAGMLAVPDD